MSDGRNAGDIAQVLCIIKVGGQDETEGVFEFGQHFVCVRIADAEVIGPFLQGKIHEALYVFAQRSIRSSAGIECFDAAFKGIQSFHAVAGVGEYFDVLVRPGQGIRIELFLKIFVGKSHRVFCPTESILLS